MKTFKSLLLVAVLAFTAVFNANAEGQKTLVYSTYVDVRKKKNLLIPVMTNVELKVFVSDGQLCISVTKPLPDGYGRVWYYSPQNLSVFASDTDNDTGWHRLILLKLNEARDLAVVLAFFHEYNNYYMMSQSNTNNSRNDYDWNGEWKTDDYCFRMTTKQFTDIRIKIIELGNQYKCWHQINPDWIFKILIGTKD